MNAEEREYSERKNLSKMKPWHKEGSDGEAPEKIYRMKKLRMKKTTEDFIL